MISEAHYNKSYDLLTQLIKKYVATYKVTLESKKSFVGHSNIGDYEIYEAGFDPSNYRQSLINEISFSDIFTNFYNHLTSILYTDNFVLFGKTHYVDIRNRVKHIIDLGLMLLASNIINTFDMIEQEFKDLYFSLYEDNFTLEIQTIMENFDSMETELVNEGGLNISITKKSNTSDTYIDYKITDTKNSEYDPMQHPRTIIDVVMGIIRLYRNPKINCTINAVKQSLGCPEIIKVENSFLQNIFAQSYLKTYVITPYELQQFKDFFQKTYLHLSEEKILMSIQRFSMACGRESDYDSLLDLVFTLEILFGSGESDSIKHKILIRLINLLSNIREIRHILYEKMSSLYSARSVIVHGMKKKQKFYRCIKNLGNYEEIVRKAIVVFIETMGSENMSLQGMLNKLDYDKTNIYEIDISSMHWKE